jgi:hypothetical protein
MGSLKQEDCGPGWPEQKGRRICKLTSAKGLKDLNIQELKKLTSKKINDPMKKMGK